LQKTDGTQKRFFVSSRELFAALAGKSTEELTFRQGLIKIKKNARLKQGRKAARQAAFRSFSAGRDHSARPRPTQSGAGGKIRGMRRNYVGYG
jgi:hypothetical protein